uniref:ZP domain-containing protein n=1 Tax=Trichuris muris TaxID=70415 RepID=A0A5S6QV59_TRIMR
MNQIYATTILSSIVISAKCRDGAMIIKLETEAPFHGTIHTYGREEVCYATGEESKVTDFVVSLTDLSECGVQYEWEQEHYWAVIVVRQHRWILTDNDKMFNVSCTTGSDSNVHPNRPAFKIALVEREEPLRRTHFGNTYQLKVWSINESYVHFNVVECEAYSGKNCSLVLTGSNAGHGLLSPFSYQRNVATANFPSMFRFVHNRLVHIQCIIEYQDDEPYVNFDVFAAASGQGGVPIATNIRRPRLQTLTSTMVMVAPPEYEMAKPKYPDCDHVNFIQLSVCIILAVMFAIETAIYWCIITRNDNDKTVDEKTYSKSGDESKHTSSWRKSMTSPDNFTENHDSGCDCCSLYEVPSRLIREN